MKKLFYSSLALFLLVIIFLLAYNFAFKTNINDATSPEVKKEDPDTSSSGFGKETPINPASSVENPINENLLTATIANDGNIYYYSLDDKAFKKANLEGKDKVTLLSNLPAKVLRVVWSPKNDSALVLLENSPYPRWHLAVFSTKTLSPLKPEITRATWNNLGDKIYYLFKNASGDSSLNKSNPDGSDWKEIAGVDKKEYFLEAVPQSNTVSLWNKPNALEESLFTTFDSETKKSTPIFKGRFGGDYLWSPNGEKVLVSSSAQKGTPLTLGIINKSGGQFQALTIPTFISKVVWSKDNNRLFYALPGGLDNATLPNDYYAKNLASQDTFWQIDLTTGKSTRILELSDINQSFDSTDLRLSPKEDILFFTDRQTGRLYKIDL
ncbi:MAG: hypothetical protein KIH67_000620 [Candidatus Moranbacteria bacterium]|nr:hypothetical protein [Candidatus Moranbacteria bacterium]